MATVNTSWADSIIESSLFVSLDAAQRRVLESVVEEVNVRPGEVLFRQGDASDAAYIVITGAMQVLAKDYNDREVIIARLERKSFFGEQGLLQAAPRPRNATLRAVNGSRLLKIPAAAFKAIHDKQSDGRLARKDAENALERMAKTSAIGDAFSQLTLAEAAPETSHLLAGETMDVSNRETDRIYWVEQGDVTIYRNTSEGLALLLRVGAGGVFILSDEVLDDQPNAIGNADLILAETTAQLLSMNVGASRAGSGEDGAGVDVWRKLRRALNVQRMGLVTQYEGVFETEPALMTQYRLREGRQVVAASLIERDAVAFREVGCDGAIDWLTSDVAAGVRIGRMSDRIVAIDAGMEWRGLGEAVECLLKGREFKTWHGEFFEQNGVLDGTATVETGTGDESSIICACTGTTRGRVMALLSEGASQSDVQACTGAGSICGSCTVRIGEVCGDEDLMRPVHVDRFERLSTDLAALKLVGADWVLPAASPGQHIALESFINGLWIRRSYTLVGTQGGEQGWTLVLKKEPMGTLSPWLFEQGRSVLLRVSQAQGDAIDAETDRPLVFMVAGVGVTPALAILNGAVTRPVAIHASVSDQSTGDVVRALMDQCGGLANLIIQNTAERGRVGASEIADMHRRFPNADWFVCGPESYEADITKCLNNLGIDEARIRVDRFTQAGEPPVDDGNCPAPVPVLPALAACPHETGRIELSETDPDAPEAAVLLEQIFAEWQQTGEHDLAGSEDVRRERLALAGSGQLFDPTTEELKAAARLGWRNANRCIGRLYWNGLEVRDRRHVRDPEAMLSEMVDHLNFATNDGKLRSLITVFAAVDEGGTEIISPQLVRYAGYRDANGQVTGDPGHIALTKMAEAAGWRGAGGAFDLLPLMARGETGRLHIRPLRPDEVLEVDISHPDYGWFSELDLKWHAVPGIASQALDAFGRKFRVVFNGWYMGTEIGARNLSDPYRYNVLPAIARRMGLDISDDASLWRDRAMLELNRAVLYSYRQAGVTMLDHHTASTEFLQFVADEHALGREVQAEWSWIVPPISGSAVTPYHLDFPNTYFKPAYVPLD
ncbi:MAG: nitric oxide synthase oxygenase [Henriciella sp.]